jgi:hypothetical protein
MDNPSDLRRLYRELSDGYAERGQPQFRDRFLVLAAAAALADGDAAGAERIRQRLLDVNPHHLLKPYTSFAQAMRVSDVQTYVQEQQQDYPPDVARGLLRSLREVQEVDDSPIDQSPIPVTAPLLNLDSGPDVLMDDDEPIQIFSFRDEAPAGLPPTLPPNKFPAPPAVAATRPPIPRTLYDKELPPPVPPPQPVLPPRQNKPQLPPGRPVSRPTPAPPRPLPVPPPPAPVPVAPPVPADEEVEPSGAWFSMLLFTICAAAIAALAWHTLLAPIILPR